MIGRTGSRVLLLAALLVVLQVFAMQPATAASDEPRPFYTPPATLPAGKGTVIRSEPMVFYTDPSRTMRAPGKHTRVLFTSTSRTGKPIAMSGTWMVPDSPYPGPRPIVVLAPGTQGLADRCAPSRLGDLGAEYEGMIASQLLSSGYAVMVPDYQGLGTPGFHAYMIRDSQSHAVLDGARVARNLGGPGVDPKNSPIGFVGYSQGGGAVAAAVEDLPSYAPELPVKGAVAGAVPADLGVVAKNLDGQMFMNFGLSATYALHQEYKLPYPPLTAKGKQALGQIPDTCVLDFYKFSGVRTSELLASGESLESALSREPYRTMVADQRIGLKKPAVPVLVPHSMLDDAIPYGQAVTMARSWCAKGGKVNFSTNTYPLHLGGYVASAQETHTYLAQRFAGWPVVSNCGWF